MKFNLGTANDYYSQRNNKYVKTIKGKKGTTTANANTMCNFTVLCEGFDLAGWRLPSGDYSQAEDNLMDFTIKNALKKDSWFAKKMPALWKAWCVDGAEYNSTTGKWEEPYWPNEIHDVMAYYSNEWLGCSNADKFNDSCLIKDIVNQIYNNRIPVPISVKFGNLNHIILLTGFENNLSETQFESSLETGFPNIVNFIYDDPYGAFNWQANKYLSDRGSGNDQILPYNLFIECAKPFGNKKTKWAHIINKPAALV